MQEKGASALMSVVFGYHLVTKTLLLLGINHVELLILGLICNSPIHIRYVMINLVKLRNSPSHTRYDIVDLATLRNTHDHFFAGYIQLLLWVRYNPSGYLLHANFCPIYFPGGISTAAND